MTSEVYTMPEEESTLDGKAMAHKWSGRGIGSQPLDLEGAAQAFRFLHGYNPANDPESGWPIFAYDPNADTWRKWEYGAGWTPKRSVLPEMTAIYTGMCALEAFIDSDDADKAEADYRKLRQKHLGGNVERSIKLAMAMMTVERWDGDADLIGLPYGGATLITPDNPKRPVHQVDADASDYLIRSMAATPKPPTQLWKDFMVSLTGEDIMLEHALQVWTAAALLPGNPHHKAHILYGDGNTGKSTYLKTIQAAMGDYAGSAMPSVFTNDKESHPAELLPFVNKRLVVLPELKPGSLRSDLLKTVTGGDSISVRGMRQNPRTETPDATLMFSANELPSIRMVDNAIKRRLLIWPFNHKPEAVDIQLGSKLQSPEHLGGVVGWLNVGLTKYVRILADGADMPIPEAVQAATDEYFTEADTIDQWCNACTVEGGQTMGSILYDSYKAYCDGRGRRPLSERSLSLWLGRHSERIHVKGGSAYALTVYP